MQKQRSYSTSSFTQERLFPISGKIISANIIKGQGFGGDYVEYKIKVATYYKIWYVKKRYSDFERLHSSLIKLIPNLPMFPPKRFFKNSDETIEERRKMFNRYLKFLFTKTHIFSYQEILDFIKIDKKVLELFIKKHSMLLAENSNKKDDNSSLSSSFNKLNIFYKSKYETGGKKPKSLETDLNDINNHIKIEDNEAEKENYYATFLDYKMCLGEIDTKNADDINKAAILVIEEFLINLSQKDENKSEIIKTFESFLKRKKKWPCFNKDEIAKLFTGEKTKSSEVSLNNQSSTSDIQESEKIIKGLMYHVGEIENNILGAQACLDFLVKLLDYEYNPECELYRYVFKTRKIEFFLEMNLHEHAKSQNVNVVNSAFKIIKMLMDEKISRKYIKMILKEESVIDKFIRWSEITDL